MTIGLTNVGFAELAGLAGNTGTCTAFTYLANGAGSGSATATNTALSTENTHSSLARSAATVSRTTTSVTNDTLRLAKTWTISTSATINEVGVFNASSGGDLLARSTTSATRTVASGDSYAVTYDIQFA